MTGFAIAAAGVLILALMSASANRKFRDRDRLPMQWSLDRKVNWSAPRPVALAFTPLLAGVVMSTIAHLLASDPATQAWTLIAIAAVFVGVHLLHLHLLEKWPAS
jgi:hypothetical protein